MPYAYTANHSPDPARETVVFVHGAAMDHCVWAHQSRYFAYHGYNVLAVDLPGHGKNEEGLLDAIGDSGAWLARFIGESVGRAFHLVGHSMGALIALETAARLSDKVNLRSLSLVGFSYPMAVTPALLQAAKETPAAAYSMMTQWSHASKIGGEPVPGFWAPGMQMRLMENSPAGAIYADLTACNNYAGGEEAFAAVDCAVLFVCGRQDKMAPAKLAKKYADANANAEIVFLPDCGHNLMAESPHGVLQALRSFVAASG